MKMKGVLTVILILTALIAGCTGLQISDSANNQAIAYASGKGVGAAINKYVPQVDKQLSTAWGDMMVSNNGADPIAVEKIMAFYQEAIMLISSQSKDPYGLLSDLTMFLAIYGGSIEYNETGGMTLVIAKPVPLKVAKAFEFGYKSGKSAVMWGQK